MEQERPACDSAPRVGRPDEGVGGLRLRDGETASHRLVLPVDANHHGTLYAGSLLRYALEAAYAGACRCTGHGANLVLRRVLSLECRRSVPVGTLVEIRSAVIHVRQCYLVTGVVGMPLEGHSLPWMDGLLGFVQIDASGTPVEFPRSLEPLGEPPLWQPLVERHAKFAKIRGSTGSWLEAGLTGEPEGMDD
jgi:acyl-CoA thioesterase YciA